MPRFCAIVGNAGVGAPCKGSFWAGLFADFPCWISCGLIPFSFRGVYRVKSVRPVSSNVGWAPFFCSMPANGHLVSGRIESPQQALLGFADGVTLCGLSDGMWGLIDMIFALLDKVGASDMVLSSWTFKGAKVEASLALAHAEAIRSLRFLADLNFMEAQPELVRALRGRFGEECVVEWKAHSKFLCLSGGAFDVLLLGSMNLHANKRFEYFTVVGGRGVASAYLEVVDDLLLNPPRVRRFSRDGLARELPA
ncbi:MAG: hypothetical protein OXF06_07350 [Bacteroidetes bacterium]|nr:hypothetical protein [Bacteroidota bacterium]